MDRELLSAYGIDYDAGLRNCMGDRDFFKSILSMFLQDDCFANIEAAYAEGDRKKLFGYVHELKGVSGNAALVDLYGTIVPLVELLRRDDGDAVQPETARLLAAAKAAYDRTCEGITLAIAEP